MTQIKKIGIVLKPKVVHDLMTMLPNLYEWLKRRKIEISLYESEADRISKIFKNNKPKINLLSKQVLLSESDLIITLGGDGTLIGVCRNKFSKSTPIFGINMGNLGFITEFSKHDFYDDLELVLKGKFKLNKVPLFKAEIFEGTKKINEAIFINDAVISKNGISRMFSVTLETDIETIYNLAGDGLIVSSPIGSTAYSLAAGGPIVHPQVRAITLTPICPHALTHRPLLLPDNQAIWIKVPKDESELSLTLDGQENITILKNQRVKIIKSSRSQISLITNPNREYFGTLKEKFKHGRR